VISPELGLDDDGPQAARDVLGDLPDEEHPRRGTQRQPGAEVVGIDPDPEMLDRARSKAGGAGLGIDFDQGFASDLPYLDRSFDRVWPA
jgi:SAM-dependent methyltransferase